MCSMAIKLAFVMAVAATAASADETTNLRAAMSAMPRAAFMTSEPQIASFVDLAAVTRHAGNAPKQQALKQLSVGHGIRPFDALVAADDGTWAEKAGTDAEHLVYVAGLGTKPSGVSIWGMANEDVAGTLFEGLTARGFSGGNSEYGVLSNGRPGVMDLMNGDPADPWKGPMGASSAVAVHGATLLQANDAATVHAFLDARAAQDAPYAATALAGIEQSGLEVIQALICPPSLGLAAGLDPAIIVGKTPDEARAALEAALADTPQGVPPYSSGILADVQGEGGPTLVMSLSYPDCHTAEIAASTAAALWDGDHPEGSNAKASHFETDSNGCAAIVSIDAEKNENARNPAFREAVLRLIRTDLSMIKIGTLK